MGRGREKGLPGYRYPFDMPERAHGAYMAFGLAGLAALAIALVMRRG